VQLALLERSGETLIIEAVSESTILLLNGEPIDEPVAGYGPFVMNTKQEIDEAFEDLRNGRLVS
jgi:quercetin 2,3-dioxygenase